jgi:hypothetical protein
MSEASSGVGVDCSTNCEWIFGERVDMEEKKYAQRCYFPPVRRQSSVARSRANCA